ncbi:MAG: ATPase [Clostridiales bacterium]|nr:ATPase [Clostridiales bacterium]
MSEITLDELKKLNTSDYELIDIRDSTAYEYGRMDNAVNIPLDCFDKERLDKSKKNILYCKSGILSINIAEELRSEGYDAYSLKEGYIGWLRQKISAENNDKERLENIEKSIRKKFHKVLFSKFAQAINQYKLVEENDRIAVCISGGKDSMLMAKLFQELLKHNKFHFELVFLVMDPGYSSENREIIEHNARLLNIPITVFESTIFDSVYNIEKSPCYVCARMRRGYLYSKAKELGCNKIALGHHFDDVIETILMGMLYSGQTQTMMPKLKSTNFEGMELIRPMYLIREENIKKWRDYNDLSFIQCACKFTDTCTSEACMTSSRTGSKRLETKHIIENLKKINPYVENNIFKSVQNVNLETIIAYKDKNGTHNFLDRY